MKKTLAPSPASTARKHLLALAFGIVTMGCTCAAAAGGGVGWPALAQPMVTIPNASASRCFLAVLAGEGASVFFISISGCGWLERALRRSLSTL
jgi:cytochrome bd-type quinol oxidase subunit 2